VAAGLPEYAVVEEDACHLLAASRGVEHLLQPFVHHVAVALQREDERVGEHALDSGRDRRRAPVQRLHEVEVHRPRERGVAPDADDRDGARCHAELLDRLEELAHRQRLATAGAHVVLLGEQEIGLQRLDLAGGNGRSRRGVDDRHFWCSWIWYEYCS
jgi:hypothetical protein